jgi:hydrogenase maturation protease
MAKDILVLGLGNLLMSDEGIGIYIVNELQKQAVKFPNAEFIDAGTGGMTVLHLIANRKKAVIIDCALMGQTPGTIRKFKPEDAESIKKVSHFSLHDVDILKVLEISKQLNECPHEIVIFGIEPAKVEMGSSLSDELVGKLENYIQLIGSELN